MHSVVRWMLLALISGTAVAQRGRQAPDSHFRVGADCARCHSVAPTASAMRSQTGDDVSPHGLWQATMMANSFRDPYFHAQMERESKGDPAAQELCLRCHAPMAHHEQRMRGKPDVRLQDVAADPMAKDGVSCTVCHQIAPEGLGTESTFSGRPAIVDDRRIFGPFPDPATAPMRNMVGYTPTQSLHVRESALCATCHTLVTEHHGEKFPEQSPYLEWRNSEFTTESGASDTSRSCQECHMPETGSTRIARNPMGREFLIPVRDGYRAHAFVGGNAFMLDMLRKNRDELQVQATDASLERMALATRRQLGEDTARLQIEGLEQKDGAVFFSVRVENRTGHKFPTGYPSRRAWLHVQVRQGAKVVFESGAFTEDGRLRDVDDELALPHVTMVESPKDVPVFELSAQDGDGKPTTSLTQMARKRKDTRLLPRGYRADGPHPEETRPVGIGADLDFTAGGDSVAYRTALPSGGEGRIQVIAWLHYQTIPPAWADALRSEEGEAGKRFVRLYDAMDKQPETVAVVTKILAE